MFDFIIDIIADIVEIFVDICIKYYSSKTHQFL